MSDLFEKSMRTLELPAVLELLAQRAVSDEAKERCRRLRPSTEAETVSHLLDEVRTTVYRQTQFAEFELKLHELAEQGVPLTADVIDSEYARIN